MIVGIGIRGQGDAGERVEDVLPAAAVLQAVDRVVLGMVPREIGHIGVSHFGDDQLVRYYNLIGGGRSKLSIRVNQLVLVDFIGDCRMIELIRVVQVAFIMDDRKRQIPILPTTL